MSYLYDPASAKKSESSRITQGGKYKGVFTTAYKLDANEKGTVGIEFSFKSDAGQVADGLRLYTVNGKGEFIYGYNILQAIMGCMNVPSVNEVQGQVEKWNSAEGKKTLQPATLYPVLMQKKIGLILQREEYRNSKTGEISSRLNIVMPFTYDTELSIGELQSGITVGSKVVDRLGTLADKVLPTAPPSRSQASAEPDFDNDIPFN